MNFLHQFLTTGHRCRNLQNISGSKIEATSSENLDNNNSNLCLFQAFLLKNMKLPLSRLFPLYAFLFELFFRRRIRRDPQNMAIDPCKNLQKPPEKCLQEKLKQQTKVLIRIYISFMLGIRFVKIRLEYSSDHITYATTNDIFLLIF